MRPQEPFPCSGHPSHSLIEQSKAALMNRMDSKFMLLQPELEKYLECLKGNYTMLEMEGCRWFTYDTLYFDSGTLELYQAHHNGKLNRFKVRTRHYVDSNQSFLEIKHKNNQRRTIKHRIEVGSPDIPSSEIYHFLYRLLGLSAARMRPALFVRYKRATLMSKDFRERITLDVDLQFATADKAQQIALPGIALVEVKCERKHENSAMTTLLKQKGLRPLGFSKYCIGTSLVKGDRVKSNRFKPVLNRLNRLQQLHRSGAPIKEQSHSAPQHNLVPLQAFTIPGYTDKTLPHNGTDDKNNQNPKESLWNQPLTSIFSSA
ncbi:hypothetical protein BTA51_19010 [Hahella sp. CCB-MM4]|uniref:polyphosphate polymerase domain-containing protein n=1 Tax=Hahella sp. (strain CCB-MM4) TaxID=1926491 RepID=UPI000BCA08B9|nr:polyphosphate polymerase domain-containing protein [Hahella sp. CCB-MM4]OZG71733.1 hypothetical protein BTA51_19010 [Hahella sp. CCB-MM4]